MLQMSLLRVVLLVTRHHQYKAMCFTNHIFIYILYLQLHNSRVSRGKNMISACDQQFKKWQCHSFRLKILLPRFFNFSFSCWRKVTEFIPHVNVNTQDSDLVKFFIPHVSWNKEYVNKSLITFTCNTYFVIHKQHVKCEDSTIVNNR